ncbi:carboxypeptidase s precursor [Dioszegia hungarica]|uniref:Carboxypeptidase s n=1 Tax=Dioszegia hungarica TaxID=4972 RepID=A0AA38LV69_9TREE|nr:carboxypeptidase s precursor [Dioszegia hungarica]KAI9637962.1 carboxypeptidase s precursor [Dioszegia hungarica]
MPSAAPAAQRRWCQLSGPTLLSLGVCFLFNIWLLAPTKSDHLKHHHHHSAPDAGKWARCPEQPKPLHPAMAWNMTEEEKKTSIDRFARAVQIPTQSYDDNGEPNEDPRWKPFFDFQTYLKDTFPLAHEKGNVEYINTLGILNTFRGSDPSLKPLVLMSHYDVVPAPESTFDRWTYPPFSGHNDGRDIWGRGASDDKTLLVAQWEAITHLLESGWEPRRTVILSHGFDEEEVSARRGQGQIAPLLEERYGKDGIFMLVDEGSGTTEDWYGGAFALPGMGEKGYLDIRISVGTPGGHSSVPPTQTGIGIMSDIVIAMEANPFETKLTPESPYLTSLMCAAEHAPSFPSKYAKLLRHPRDWPKLASLLSSSSASEKAMISTTQAVDVISGGVKVNALPELVTALVNYRIDFSESINSTQRHVERVLRKEAKKMGLDFYGFSQDRGKSGKYVAVEIFGPALEPAPRSPMEGEAWELFAGTVRAVFNDKHGKPMTVAPSASTGNTDCKMYYNLTKNIYRFMGSPASLDRASGIHTVNERASIEGHYSVVRWIHALVQNVDASLA